MIKLVPPSFRINEESIKSMLNCFYCNDPSSSSCLYLAHCSLKSNIRPCFSCRSCKKYVDCECNPRCGEFQSQEAMIANVFYSVNCYKHKERNSEVVDVMNFLPICNDTSHTKLNTIKLSYSQIEDIFFSLYRETENFLCSDRKKILVTYSCKKLLNACRWMDQVHNGLFCKKHPGERAKFVNLDLSGLCKSCAKGKDLIALVDVSNAVEKIIGIINDKGKSSKLEFVNKYILKLIKINKTYDIRTEKNLNLLLLEGQSFIKEKNKFDLRCVNCMSKVSVGWKKGIKLNCSHILCLKCFVDSSNSNCPIDNLMAVERRFLKNRWSIPKCHAEHFFKSDCYKLPCFHYSCHEHLTEFCYTCGFKLSLWPSKPKLSNSVQNLINFHQLSCKVHNRPICLLSCDFLSMYCDNCEHTEDAYNIHENEQLFYESVQRSFFRYFSKASLSPLHNVNNNILCFLNFLSIRTFNEQYTGFLITSCLLNEARSFPMYNYFFATSLAPKVPCSNHLLKLDQTTKIVLKFRVNMDLIFKGFIIACSYFPLNSSDQVIFRKPIQVVHNIYEEKNLVDSNSYQYFNEGEVVNSENIELDNFMKERIRSAEFHSCIYLCSSKVHHEFIVNLNAGYYFYYNISRKICVGFIENLKFNKSDYGDSVINGNITSPILGLSVHPAVSLLR